MSKVMSFRGRDAEYLMPALREVEVKRMKMGKAIRCAVKNNDPAMAGGVADYMRFRLGWNWERSFRFVHDLTGVDRARWDALLYAADEGYDHTLLPASRLPE